MNDSVLVTRIVLKNYKSIAACSVRLRQASRQTQILVTSHSPNLLDDPDST